MENKRNYGIDLLRILCMIMIPVLHILGKGALLSTPEKGSIYYNSAWLLEAFCYSAVNCFGIISGYVGYGRKVKYTNLVMLWLRVIFYSVIIGLIFILVKPELETTDIISSFFPTLTGAYWYFTAYAGMFLFTPFINKGLESLSKKQLYVAIVIFLVLFSLLPTIGTLIIAPILGTNYNNMVNSFSLNAGYSVVWLSVLYIIGALMKKYDLPSKLKNNISLILFVGCTLLNYLLLLLVNALTNNVGLADDYLVMGYLNPLMVIAAYSLVCLCINLKIKNKLFIKLIEFFSPLCFSVYLIHMQPFVKKYALTNKFLFLLDYSPLVMVLMVIVYALLIFIVCSLIDELRELLFKKLKFKEKFSNLENKILSKD